MIPRYKDIIELVKKGATVEAQEKILELREAALELQEENMQLKEELSKLKQVINKKENMVYHAPFYWIEDEDSKDGPFCQNCFDSVGKSIRLQKNDNDCWNCLNCNKSYTGPNFKEHNIEELGIGIGMNNIFEDYI